jgi:hypothetical protein
VGEIIVPERRKGVERSSKRREVENEVSREDTRCSGSRVVESEVISLWLIRDAVESQCITKIKEIKKKIGETCGIMINTLKSCWKD